MGVTCTIDNALQEMGHKGQPLRGYLTDPQTQVPSSVILTLAVLAAMESGGKHNKALAFAPLTFTVSYSIVPGTLTLSASGFPADGRATVSAGPYSATLGGGSSQTVSATPGVYRTSASAEVSVSRSQGSVSWTEVYTLRSVSPTQVTLRSYGSASVTAAYSGPLPGTLCYDGSCRQAAPGYYTAPPQEVINTWTETRTEDCPPGYTGSVTVTESWRTVKYWTPSAGGLSSRGTLAFNSATRDEMVDRTESRDCEPKEPPTQDTNTNTQTTETNTQTTPDKPTNPPGPGPSDTNDTGDTNTDEADWSGVNIDLGVIPSSSQTNHLSQRPVPLRPRATLLPFLPPRQGLW